MKLSIDETIELLKCYRQQLQAKHRQTGNKQDTQDAVNAKRLARTNLIKRGLLKDEGVLTVAGVTCTLTNAGEELVDDILLITAPEW